MWRLGSDEGWRERSKEPRYRIARIGGSVGRLKALARSRSMSEIAVHSSHRPAGVRTGLKSAKQKPRCSGGARQTALRVLRCFQHRQDVPRRILEPCYGWPVSAGNASRIRFQVWLIVDFKSHTALAELIHRFFHVVHGKVQHRKCGGLMVRFRIDQSLGLARNQGALRSSGNFQPERLPVKSLAF